LVGLHVGKHFLVVRHFPHRAVRRVSDME
jgi:hypothetical protein